MHKKIYLERGCPWSKCRPLGIQGDFVCSVEFGINYGTSRTRDKNATYECCPKQ